MSEYKLTQGSYYLVEKESQIFEIKCERVVETCYYIKTIYSNNKETPCTYEWVKKYMFEDSNRASWAASNYKVLEELDASFYRQQKLERITNDDQK